MNFMRHHWFDVGLAAAVPLGIFLVLHRMDWLALLLWVNLISLLLHQFEEYRFPGYFPGMMNTVMFSSDRPDRYPLNTNTALIVNLSVGWLSYLLAALLGERALWLAIATVLVSAGNFVAHTFLFNIKGKTLYNPGMVTAIVLFGPIAVLFFVFIIRYSLVSPAGWITGILLGIVLNYVGILKLIDWMKNPESAYIFPPRFMPPSK
jgi:hypothetical protein